MTTHRASTPVPTEPARPPTPDPSPDKRPAPTGASASGAGPSAAAAVLGKRAARQQKKEAAAAAKAAKKAQEDVPLGEGGCVAHVLSEFGVFDTADDAKAALNKEIDNVWQQRRREVSEDFERKRVGVENDLWCAELVGRVVRARDFHFRKVNLDKHDLRGIFTEGDGIDLEEQEGFPSGFLVDGVLNKACVVDGVEQTNDPTDPTDPSTHEQCWRHAVAVVNGEVREQHDERFTVAGSFHIGEDNQIDMSKGYMRKILKVVHIARCRKPGTGCTGECLFDGAE